MYLSGAAGRKKNFVVGLNVGLRAVLSVVGRLHIHHNTTPVVNSADDTTIIVLHAVLYHKLGHQSHTMVADQ